MLLKYFSTKEFNLEKNYKAGLLKLSKLSKFEKYMTFFWLLGPFIYLIERDPADLWLTLISIIFIVRCIIRKEWEWTKQWWFRFALCLWIWGIISAINSPYSSFSFAQGFVWIRFPVYVAAAQAWLAKDRDIRALMMISIIVGISTMSLILLAESFFYHKIRLTWPYGDLVPGTYIAKLGLSFFCCFVPIAISKFDKKKIILSILLILGFLACFLTGERMSFIILFFSTLVAILLDKNNLVSNILKFLLLTIFLLATIFSFNQKLLERYSSRLINSIPILNTSNIVGKIDNPYWGAWRSGIHQGLSSPIMGLGPSSSRKVCKTLPNDKPSWLPGKNYCGNHPHNFYIQLFAETGVIGLILGTSMFLSIIFKCYSHRKQNGYCPLTSTSFIIPLVLFFPIQQTGSFFGQWGNLFIWFAVGYAVAQIQNKNKLSD